MTKVFLISLLASLGGVAVAWGIFLESFGGKPEYIDIDDFRSSQRKSHCGQKWVFWGVIAEIILGFGIAIWEGAEMISTDRKIQEADPLNQPIVTVSATVDLWVDGTTPAKSKFPAEQLNSTQLAFGNPSEETHGAPTLFFSNANFVNRTNLQTEWLFLFNEKPLSFSFPNKLVRDSTNWSVFELSVRFLPPETQVTKGTINLIINSKPVTVTILPQKVKNHETDFDEYLKSPTAGVTVFGK